MKEKYKDLIKDFRIMLHFVAIVKGVSLSYLLLMVGSAFFLAVSPFVNILIPRYIIDELINQQRLEVLTGLVALLVGLNFILSLINRYLAYKLDLKNFEILNSFNLIIGKKMMDMKFENIEDPDFLDLKEKAIYGVNNQRAIERMIKSLITLIKGAFSLLGIVAIIASLNTLILVYLVLAVLVNNLVLKKVQKIRLGMYEVIIPLNRVIQYFDKLIKDFSIGKEVRVNHMGPVIMDNYKSNHDKSVDEFKKKYHAIYRLLGINKVSVEVQMVLVYVYISFLVLAKRITIGEFSMYLTSTMKFNDLLSEMSSTFLEFRQMCKLLDPYLDLERVESLSSDRGLATGDMAAYEIRFDKVSFKYPRSDHYALKHVSLVLNHKEKISIVGENGSGKSTFIKLIARLYEPTEGTIYLNDRDIRDYSYKDYRQLLGIVFQDYKLFAFTVKENVAFDDCEARGAIEESLQQAGVKADIDRLKAGLDTHVYKIFEEDGIELSGGQAQKVAIARAIYKDAPIMMLDEPTAALDPIAEYEIFETFNQMTQDKMSLIISHRLSSCQLSQRVLVFDQGQLIQDGSHQDLMQAVGDKYQVMYKTQSQYYTEDIV